MLTRLAPGFLAATVGLLIGGLLIGDSVALLITGTAHGDEPIIERERWVCVETMIKHNTPGERDGEQAFWIDGQLRGHWTGFLWRTAPGLLTNSVTVESYVTDRWTKNRGNTVYCDNVVVAKKYIGPAAD